MLLNVGKDDVRLPTQHFVDVKWEQKSDQIITDWIYWVAEHRKPRIEQLERLPQNT